MIIKMVGWFFEKKRYKNIEMKVLKEGIEIKFLSLLVVLDCINV